MNVMNKIVVITGAGHGIGKALAEKFSGEGAIVIVTDLDESAANAVASSINGHAYSLDVSNESEIKQLVETIESKHGPIHLFCSNAGIGLGDGAPWWATSASNDVWEKLWQVNVMSHVYAARACLPYFIKRGFGWFLNTASAAGLLNQIGDAAYSTTKHAAVGFAESLAITHGDDGIGVSVLAPQGVATRLIGMADGNPTAVGVITPKDVADAAWKGLKNGEFMILPHPETKDYFFNKAQDYNRWVGGMRKLRRVNVQATGEGLRLPVSKTEHDANA